MNDYPTPPAAPVVEEWNPLANVTPVEHRLKTSGGRAAVLLKKWSGRERLSYEDATTERFLTKAPDGDDTVKIGSMRLYALSMTVVGSTGFPARGDGSAFLSGTREQREADLLALNEETYDEIREAALAWQPLPSAAGGDEDDEDEGGDEGTLADPSPASSTHPTPIEVAGQ